MKALVSAFNQEKALIVQLHRFAALTVTACSLVLLGLGLSVTGHSVLVPDTAASLRVKVAGCGLVSGGLASTLLSILFTYSPSLLHRSTPLDRTLLNCLLQCARVSSRRGTSSACSLLAIWHTEIR